MRGLTRDQLTRALLWVAVFGLLVMWSSTQRDLERTKLELQRTIQIATVCVGAFEDRIGDAARAIQSGVGAQGAQ